MSERVRRALLRSLAVLFVAVIATYSIAWIYAVRRSPPALGIEVEASSGPGLLVGGVRSGGPADRAGVRAGDRVIRVAGVGIEDRSALANALAAATPGQALAVTVRREARTIDLSVVPQAESPAPGLTRRVAENALSAYPLLFLMVATAVLLLRPDDRNAWLMALLFAAFIGGAPYLEAQTPAPLRSFGLAYKVAFSICGPALFLFVFSVFPSRSPLDRRAPWLKWAWLAVGLAFAVPFAIWAFRAPSADALMAWAESLPRKGREWCAWTYSLGAYILGFGSLVANALTGPAVARRKSRVILGGTLVGFAPAFGLFVASTWMGRAPYDLPFWTWASVIILLSLMPLSFAYAVVRHRVLEIPVLLRRSARYLLVQRGAYALVLILVALDAWIVARLMATRLRPWTEAALPVALTFAAGFGGVLVWTGARVHRRMRERIDRAFFRSAYDARQVLQDLAERARAATSREDLAALLEHQVASALLPRALVVYLDGGDSGVLRAARGRPPAGAETLPATLPPLLDAAARARAREVDPRDWASDGPLAPLGPMEPECLAPLLGRDERLLGLLVLGPRLSEEPYSGEDKRLLSSVASQAGIALESIRLAEQIAVRLEAERRAAHELDIAKQVQARLLPEAAPALATLECAGRCVQARAVGGDYYDFLDLGPGVAGLALADVSGKGFPAALLMANLQAMLRSRTAQELRDLRRQLASVNQLLYRSTETNRFATAFAGIYEDATRTLTFANCGHNPPLLLRATGEVVRLCPTGPALGLFEDWSCETERITLRPGDVLALYTDGVTEAADAHDREYGEEGLLRALRSAQGASAETLLEAVLEDVARFAGGEQRDDLTLVVARAR